MTLRKETITVQHGYDAGECLGAAKPPLISSSTFVYPSAAAAKELHEAFFDGKEGPRGFIYGRLGHPNLEMAERRLAALDGAEEAAIFASGMAAASAALFA